MLSLVTRSAIAHTGLSLLTVLVLFSFSSVATASAKGQDEICDDAIDNDGDSFIDCQDFDCIGTASCPELICDDSIDNDGDTFIDCADIDCFNTEICGEISCNDGIDNDGNNFTDCEDFNCSGDPACGEGEGAPCIESPIHTADQNADNVINLSELLRVIQFFNSTGYSCEAETEDGFAPDGVDQTCCPHYSDYNPQDWEITLTELLRLIQFFNSTGYTSCPFEDSEDGFCPGAP